jgi:hypothetical protein
MRVSELSNLVRKVGTNRGEVLLLVRKNVASFGPGMREACLRFSCRRAALANSGSPIEVTLLQKSRSL